MKIANSQLRQIVKEELESVLQEGVVGDFARKYGLPIAVAASLLASSPGCAVNPFSKTCDMSVAQQVESPREEMRSLMRKHNIKSWVFDGSFNYGTFIPSKRMARKYPKLKGGVDVSDVSYRNSDARQLKIMKQALGETR